MTVNYTAIFKIANKKEQHCFLQCCPVITPLLVSVSDTSSDVPQREQCSRRYLLYSPQCGQQKSDYLSIRILLFTTNCLIDSNNIYYQTIKVTAVTFLSITAVK